MGEPHVTAIGMGLAFGAYALGMWGYCLVRGYNVPFTSMFGQTWPGSQVNMTAPTAGRKLGTINNNTEVTSPGQLSADAGQ
jgi:hypothetical protein